MKKQITGLFLILLTVLNVMAQQPAGNVPIKVDTGYINVVGGKLYYEAAGAGEYVVLLHDGTVHNEVWDGQFSVLAME